MCYSQKYIYIYIHVYARLVGSTSIVPAIVLHITYQCHAIYTDIFRIHESQHCNFHDLNTDSLSAFKALAITPPLRSRVFATPVLAYKGTMHRHPV